MDIQPSPFRFDYSYLELPATFYSRVKPTVAPQPEVLLLNKSLCETLHLDSLTEENLTALLYAPSDDLKPFAQAYAGHQFGNFTKLGDGRAIVLGEHLTSRQQRFDIQLKGSGRTPYSRGGDGKATLRAMLREYLMSEAMYHLHIPTSRSLAVVKTGETVYRETSQAGAAVVRVMQSHIRVGTFEYAAYLGTAEDLRALIAYTLNRLFPDLAQSENPPLALFTAVMERQIQLVAHWIRVGFIHGVMNTDNVAISGETFDYGPCAFMNAYDPATVFSSIDHGGRYAYGNQPRIIKWNLARFIETLLPLFHPEKETALALAQAAINGFDAQWKTKYYDTFLRKIGIEQADVEGYALVEELLETMKTHGMDYTNTFFSLRHGPITEDEQRAYDLLAPWRDKWKSAVEATSSWPQAQALMKQHNPVFIPRNHLVEQALDEAVKGDLALFNTLLDVLSHPYEYREGLEGFRAPTGLSFEKSYRTFCGT